jgi:hypothetical protein
MHAFADTCIHTHALAELHAFALQSKYNLIIIILLYILLIIFDDVIIRIGFPAVAEILFSFTASSWTRDHLSLLSDG